MWYLEISNLLSWDKNPQVTIVISQDNNLLSWDKKLLFQDNKFDVSR